MNASLLPFCLSFVHDQHLAQARFLATQDQGERLMDRAAALQPGLNVGAADVQNLTVYPLSASDGSPLGARHLVDTVVEAIDADPSSALSQVQALADAIDAAVLKAQRSSTVEPALFEVEFVWDNGGGDDNAFSQGFAVPPGPTWAKKAAAFGEALCDLGENEGWFYDGSCARIDDGPQAFPLKALMTWVRKETSLTQQAPELIALLDEVRAVEAHHALDAHTPAVPKARRGRSSRL